MSQLQTKINEVITQMQTEIADCKELSAGTEDTSEDVRAQAAALADMVDAWRKVLAISAETIGARETLLTRVRFALLAAVGSAKDKASKGATADIVLADIAGALDHVLPPRRPG